MSWMGDLIWKLLPWPLRKADSCSHLDQMEVTSTEEDACEECLKAGGEWVHLRMCLVCGTVGCCDQSPGKHATAHFHASDHPIMRSIEPGESWVWCFPDKMVVGQLEPDPA